MATAVDWEWDIWVSDQVYIPGTGSILSQIVKIFKSANLIRKKAFSALHYEELWHTIKNIYLSDQKSSFQR